MEILALIEQYGPWAWIVLGLVLLAVELVMPGGVFVWFGTAGILTGLISFVVPMGLPMQGVIFGVLSIVGIVIWLRVRSRFSIESDRPFLNQRAKRMIGQKGFLSEPIVGQVGRMELGESVWRVTGPELPVGHYVEVIGQRGALLEVKSANEEGRVESV